MYPSSVRHNVRVKSLFVFILLLMLSIPADLYAQGSDLQFDHVLDLGVQSNQILQQDYYGFLWIGTKDGLFRYDGYELKHYAAGPGELSNTHIYGLVEDPLDPAILWIGTKDGLNRLDQDTETFQYYKHDPNDPNSLNHNAINIVLQDGEDPNILWVGTENGLAKFDKQTESFTRYTPVPNDPTSIGCGEAWRVIEDAEDANILWIATWGCGLEKFDKHTEKFTHYVHDPDDSTSLQADVVVNVAQDEDDPNILWVGSVGQGLGRFDKRAETFHYYTHQPDNPHSIPAGVIALIHDDGNGTLWMGGWVDDNGLILFDKATETFTTYHYDPSNPRSLSSSLIIMVYEDYSGITWILNTAGQLDKYDPQRQNFVLYRHNTKTSNSLVNDVVNVIYESQGGSIWLGTQAGVSQFDRKTETFTNYTHDPANPASLGNVDQIVDIKEDAHGNLWLAHFPGALERFDTETGKVIDRYPLGVESVTIVIPDPETPEILWLATRPQGFSKFNTTTEEIFFYESDDADFNQSANMGYLYTGLHDRYADAIWLGSWEGGGLVRFDKQTETFTYYQADPHDPNSISVDAIASIYQDAEGLLWISTLGGGLEKFDPRTETFTHYSEEHGIPATVDAVLEDATGCLWMSTDRGIVKFNPQTEEVEKHYTQSDGLQGDAFLKNSALKTQDGKLWFGGTNGVNYFDPAALSENSYVPPVVLTALTQGGEPLPNVDVAPERLQEITFDWRNNYFEFEYAALNYTQPDKNQYQYMLEGVDKDWFEAGTRRFGRYTGLRGGTYVLRVKGSNNDGVWNEEGIALSVRVTPPFWRTWWFASLCIVLVLGVFGVVYYSKAKQLEAERESARVLQKSEERLRQVVQNMPVMMDAFDEAGTVLVWNRECERVTGYRMKEMIGNPQAMDKLYPDPDYRAHVFQTWQEREGNWRGWESQIQSKDGALKTIAWSNISRQFPIPGWDEWAIGVDITKRKQAELERERLLEEVQAQARRVQHIIDTVPEGVMLLTAEGRVVSANPEAQAALYTLAKARVGDVVKRLGDHTLEKLLTSPPTKGLWHEVHTSAHNNATTHTYEIIARPMENGHMPEDWVLVLRDVTKEREIQNRIQRQERLASIGQLAAGIAHDFNNILAVVMLYAQMTLRSKHISERDHERLSILDSQAKHAARLIQQILDFSRRAVFERYKLDLLPLLKEQVQLLKRTLSDNIKVEFVYEPDTYEIWADPTRIQQMLTNLALNARDAMPEGGELHFILDRLYVADLDIPPVPNMPSGEWFQLSVSDTGTGIPEDVMPQIFEPFFTTKPPGKGSGLGLPQVHGIVGAHDGYVDVKSEVGAGTTVTVYLPVLKRDRPEPVKQPERSLVYGNGEVILVIEDNEDTRRAVIDSLELLNYQALSANDGQEALVLLEEHADEVALILTDMVMPKMGGIALLNTLQEKEVTIKVVMMTGHPFDIDVEDSQRLGVVGWLAKPIDLTRLSEAIAQGLSI